MNLELTIAELQQRRGVIDEAITALQRLRDGTVPDQPAPGQNTPAAYPPPTRCEA